MPKPVKFILGALLLLAVCDSALAEPYSGCKKYPSDNTKDGKPYVTPFGLLELYRCSVGRGEDSIDYVVLGGRPLFKDSLDMADRNKERTVFLYGGGVGRESMLGGCAGTQYLLDLKGSKPKLMTFGIKNACNQIDTVKWKKDRVTINFNREALFVYVYATGKMQLPKDDPDRYDPVFDENSPVIDKYQRSGYPHQKYELAPPYAKEITLNW